jgi:hypothetical protein
LRRGELGLLLFQLLLFQILLRFYLFPRRPLVVSRVDLGRGNLGILIMELQVILGLFCDFLARPSIPNLFGFSDFAKQRLVFFVKLLKFGHVLDFRLTVSKNVIRSILKSFMPDSAGPSSLGEHTTW